MNLKENIAGINFKAIKKGIIKPKDTVKLFGKLEFVISRKLSKAGRFLRKNQLSHIADALNPERKRVWTSVLFPAELVYPFGAMPLPLEILSGLFATVGLSQEFLDVAGGASVPNTMCSFHRLLFGLARSGYFAAPDAVAATSLFCDGNLKSFNDAALANKSPFMFLDIPFEENEASVRYLKDQLSELVGKFSEMFGGEHMEENLRRSVVLANEGMKRLKRIYSLRKVSSPNIFRGHEMINFCFPSHYLLGSDVLVKIADKMIESFESGGDRHGYYRDTKLVKGCKRLMWMHIVPQYDTPLWDLIDNGVTSKIVCEEYTAPYFDGYDVSDPLGSIARRLISHPSNGELSRRVEHAIKIAKDFNVDGVVHYSSWGCHQAAGNVSLIEREFEKNGIKFLNLNGDAVDKKNTTFGQHKTRVEAFLEAM